MTLLSIFQLGALILSVVLNVVLALFVYRNNPKSATNKIFAALSVLITLWIITYYPSIFYLNSLLILTAARINALVAAPMNFIFFLFAHTLPNNKIKLSRFWMRACAYGTLLTMIISASDLGYSEIKYVGGVPQLIPGPGMAVFAIQSLVFIIATIFVLWEKMRDPHSQRTRDQARFIMFGIGLMLLSMFFAVFIPVVLFQNNTFLPLSPLFGLIFLGMTAFAIVKHGFLDIRFIVIRAIVFIIANILLALGYAWLIVAILGRVPYLSGTDPYVAGVMIVTFAILIFRPVENRLILATNKIFFRGEYDREAFNSKLTHIMAETIVLGDLISRIIETLKLEMRVSTACFALIKNHKVMEVLGSHCAFSERDFSLFDSLFHRQGKNNLFYLFEDLEEGKTKDMFRRFEISLAIPIKIENNEIAILILGPKLSGDIYHERDVEFLGMFASEVGIAIQNSQSFEEIKRFSKELEKMVEERTVQLKEAQKRELEKAQALAKLKDEFVYIAAHELRAPVTAIKGFIELSTEDTTGYSDLLKSDLNSIKTASSHLSTLVNDLLEVARSEAGTLKVEVKTVDVVPLIKKLLNEFAPMALEKKVKLNLNTGLESIFVRVDEEKTREVFANLVGNAVKYNRNEGMVDVNISEENGSVSVEVKDTGFGIPRAEQGRVFEKFFRVKNNDTKGILGTGLGLFISKMLVDKMGGKITFSSVEGVGTSFVVYFSKV